MGYQMQRICRLTQYIKPRKWQHFIAWGGTRLPPSKMAAEVNLILTVEVIESTFHRGNLLPRLRLVLWGRMAKFLLIRPSHHMLSLLDVLTYYCELNRIVQWTCRTGRRAGMTPLRALRNTREKKRQEVHQI